MASGILETSAEAGAKGLFLVSMRELVRSILNTVCYAAVLICCLDASVIAQPVAPWQLAVEVSAEVRTTPAEIHLRWRGDPNATAYLVARKRLEASSWQVGPTLPGNETEYIDEDVAIGSAYEYRITKVAPNYFGYGYIYAGIEVPLIEARGTVILVVDQTHAVDLGFELLRLQQDLVGDGWTVIRHDVARDVSPVRVKQLIQASYNADPQRVKALFLFGHVPVPYSGDIAPDEHPNHRGAWPADTFYADIDGLWTDATVNATTAEKKANWNVPGDGKFDPSVLPSDLELQVGRVDLSNMTAFANKIPARTERDLLRQYLEKNHRFRHRRFTADRRALICDNFGPQGDPIASSAWRNFAPFVGPDSMVVVGRGEYFPRVTRESYLWSFGAGGGGYTTCDGIGSTDDFAAQDIRTVFTMFLGSFFGDWNNESNFLRAPLAAGGYSLAAIYSGFPHWVCHPMALGQTIGFSTWLSQNNRPRGLYPPHNTGSHQVHIALMGDPTLRMHPVIPPANLTASYAPGGLRLEWNRSTDDSIVGYHVYKSGSAHGPFTRISGSTPTRETHFVDASFSGPASYMVRAVKLERTPSGTYFNPSQGIVLSTARSIQTPLELTARERENLVELEVAGAPGQRFTIESTTNLADWTPLLSDELEGGVFQFTDPVAEDAPRKFYRARKIE